jgi:phage-related protein
VGIDVGALSVRFYRTASGAEPVLDWLREQTPEIRKAVGTDIKTVQLGWPLGMPLVRKMAADLWEIRSRFPAGIARVLFTVVRTDIVLLHGFIKKSETTPATDLALARKRHSILRGDS